MDPVKEPVVKGTLNLLVGYHGEPTVNLYMDYTGIILPQKVKGYLLYY